MKRRQRQPASGQVQKSVAVRERDRDNDYDISSPAWVELDRWMTEQLTDLERRFERYFTPVAIRKGLGR